MKESLKLTIMAISIVLGVLGSCKGGPPVVRNANVPDEATKKNDAIKGPPIKITVRGKSFTATLANNPAASAFKAMLPLTLEMSDLHGNEKFFQLSTRLPSNDANPGTLRTGDLMLWNSKTVVVFYKTFSTPYSYTRLGSVDDPEGLSAAVGAGNITMKIEAR